MIQPIKRPFILLAFVLIAALPAAAQQRDTIRPASRPIENNRKQLMEELNLTKKQLQEFKALNGEYGPKLKALRSDSTLDKKQRRQQVMQLAQEREDKIKDILTPEQMTKYRELQKEQMQNRRNGKAPAENDNP
ncbi:MAG TPA: hypothetical protein VGM41_02255 [Chitinophagaceae bacterium]|jgi:Spy/CpxP family protein refolding chaperone